VYRQPVDYYIFFLDGDYYFKFDLKVRYGLCAEPLMGGETQEGFQHCVGLEQQIKIWRKHKYMQSTMIEFKFMWKIYQNQLSAEP
jgi:hypothetical protein